MEKEEEEEWRKWRMQRRPFRFVNGVSDDGGRRWSPYSLRANPRLSEEASRTMRDLLSQREEDESTATPAERCFGGAFVDICECCGENENEKRKKQNGCFATRRETKLRSSSRVVRGLQPMQRSDDVATGERGACKVDVVVGGRGAEVFRRSRLCGTTFLPRRQRRISGRGGQRCQRFHSTVPTHRALPVQAFSSGRDAGLFSANLVVCISLLEFRGAFARRRVRRGHRSIATRAEQHVDVVWRDR